MLIFATKHLTTTQCTRRFKIKQYRQLQTNDFDVLIIRVLLPLYLGMVKCIYPKCYASYQRSFFLLHFRQICNKGIAFYKIFATFCFETVSVGENFQ